MPDQKNKQIIHHLGNKKSNYKTGTGSIKNKAYKKRGII